MECQRQAPLRCLLPGGNMKSMMLFILGIAVLAIPIFSQAPGATQPSFEVATIKVHPPPLTRIIITAPPGRFVAEGMSLRMLIARAYSMGDTKVLGGPNWADSDHYDIEAKVGGGGTIPPGQMPVMLQGLLEDRFK